MARFKNLADALYRALTGRSPRSEGKNTQEKAAALVAKHGSTREAAKAAGVSQRTMQKWVKGTQSAKNTSRGKNADKLASAERQARVTKAGAKRVAKSGGSAVGPGGGLRIKALITISDDTRERTIRPGEYLPDGAMYGVVARFIAEGPEAAAQELQDLLNVYYFNGGRGVIEEITDIGF